MSASKAFNITPSGRIQKPKTLKLTDAEMHLREKYEETRSQASRASAREKDERESMAIKGKLGPTLLLQTEDESKKNNVQRSKKQSRNDLEVNAGANVNITTNVNVSADESQHADFLQTKFGTSNILQKGQLSRTLDPHKANSKQSQHGQSLTKQIFVNDARQTALLPIETESKQQLSVTNQSKDVQEQKISARNGKGGEKRVLRPGFSSYLEQEQLDRASVNDLISSHGRLVKGNNQSKYTVNDAVDAQSSVHDSLSRFVTLNSEMYSIGRQPVKPVDIKPLQAQIEEGLQEDATKTKTEQKVQPVSQFSSQRNLLSAGAGKGSKRQSVCQDETPNNKADDVMSEDRNRENNRLVNLDSVGLLKSAEKRDSDLVSVLGGGKPPQLSPDVRMKSFAEEQKDKEAKNFEQESKKNEIKEAVTPFEDSPPKPKSIDAEVELLKQPSADRPMSQSSMGRFVSNILHHDGRYQKKDELGRLSRNNCRNNAIVSKSIDVSKMKRKSSSKLPAVINQDSFLIKHDFDAGKSKLWQTHMMTQKAHFRMQQLIAMLRHKTGSQVPAGGDDDPYNHLDEDEDEEQPDMEQSDDEEARVNGGSPIEKKQIIIEDQDSDVQSTEEEQLVLPSIGRSKGNVDTRDATDEHDGLTKKRATEQFDLTRDQAEKTKRSEVDKEQMIKTQKKISEEVTLSPVRSPKRIFGAEFKDIEKQIKVNFDKFKPVRSSMNSSAAKTARALGSAEQDFKTGAKAFESKDYRNHKYDKNQVSRDLFGAKITSGPAAAALENFNGLSPTNDSFLDKMETFEGVRQSINLKRNLQSARNIQDKLRLGALLKQNQAAKRKIINTDYLTQVPKRGRMIDTQKYIRENLQAYADNKNFGFSRATKDPLKVELNMLSPAARTRTLIVGQPIHNMENRRFLSPTGAVRIPPIEISTKPAGGLKSAKLDFDPIVPPKKRATKTLRISRQRRHLGQSIDTAKQLESMKKVDEMDVLLEENQDLRTQVENMVEVFQQYLKVATLKDTAERMQGKVLSPDGVIDGGEVPQSVQQDIEKMNLSSQPNLQNDSQLDLQESEPGRQSQLTPRQRQKHSRRRIKISTVNQGLTAEMIPRLESTREFFKNRLSSVREAGAKTSRAVDLKYLYQDKLFNMNHHMPYMKSPLNLNLASSRTLLSKRRSSQQLSQSQLRLRTKGNLQRSTSLDNLSMHGTYSVGKRPVKASAAGTSHSGGGIIGPIQMTILAASEHRTHNRWLVKIQALWDKIYACSDYQEIIRIEQQIISNRKQVKLLQIENMKGNARCLALDVKLMKKQRSKPQSQSSKKLVKLGLKLMKLQQRIKTSMERSAEFNIWGFNSHIIAHVVKCRVLEDLINLAQKRAIRPDQEVERELWLMRMLQKQTWQDINYFLKQRNQDKWRTWDNPRNLNYLKTSVDGFNKVSEDKIDLEQLSKYAEQNNEIEDWKSKLSLVDRDSATHVQIAREMTSFLNYQFGNSAWLTLSRLHALRKLNKEKGRSLELKLQEREDEKSGAKSQFNWLQLTPGHVDITVYGSELYWQKILKLARPEEFATAENIVEETSEEGGHRLLDLHERYNKQAYDFGQVPATPMPLSANLTPVGAPNQTDQKSLIQIADTAAATAAETRQPSRENENNGVPSDEPKGTSNWQLIIEKEKKQAEERKRAQEEARAKRLANLFKDDVSDDDEDLEKKLDFGAAEADINNLMDKVDIHLQVEMNILKKWQQKDLSQLQDREQKNNSSVLFMPAVAGLVGQQSLHDQAAVDMNRSSQPDLSPGWSSNPHLNENFERSRRSQSVRKQHEEAMELNRLKRQSSSIGKFNDIVQRIKGKHSHIRSNSNGSLYSFTSQEGSMKGRTIVENPLQRQDSDRIVFGTLSKSPSQKSALKQCLEHQDAIEEEDDQQPLRIKRDSQIFVQ